MAKEIDILDILPAEAIQKVDALGYSFLQERGYDADGAVNDVRKRSKLKKALKRNNEELRYTGAIDSQQGAILVWFELFKNNELLAKSKGIKFIQRVNENEQGRENFEGQTRLAATSEDNT
jgi:hypothetical protein